jgi:predicted nuclease of predicted toxin-antitoxin system
MRLLADENLHVEIVQGLRQAKYEVLFVPDIGLAGHKDQEILEYSEKNDLIVISGDKDFGGLIEFGHLWGHGKVILIRYRFINIRRIVQNILEVLNREIETFHEEKSYLVVLSESGYRIHKPVEREGR